jgi:antitoxin Phd
MVWQLQEAKNKLSEVVDLALKNGPQEITRHGKKTAVLLSMEDYRRLKARKGTLADFFRDSPLGDIVLERSKDLPRSIEF